MVMRKGRLDELVWQTNARWMGENRRPNDFPARRRPVPARACAPAQRRRWPSTPVADSR